MALSVDERRVNELTTAVYTCTIEDEAGDPLPLSSLDAITLTLDHPASGEIINSRDAQDVKNGNNVTIHATSGLLTWIMQPADNAIVGDTLIGSLERHEALFEWTYDTSKKGKHVVLIDVLNLRKVA